MLLLVYTSCLGRDIILVCILTPTKHAVYVSAVGNALQQLSRDTAQGNCPKALIPRASKWQRSGCVLLR